MQELPEVMLLLDGLRANAASDELRSLAALHDQHASVGRAWLQEDITQLFLILVSLAPQQQLMRRIIDISSAWAEVSRLHKALEGEQRSFAITEFVNAHCRGGFVHEHQQHIMANLLDPGRWGPAMHHEETSTDMVRFGLRAASVVHELLAQRCVSFPVQPFQILHNPDAASKIIQDWHQRPCIMDTFTLQHCEVYSDEEKLLSPESLEILSAAALLFIGSIYSTETLHSRHSKRANLKLTYDLTLQSVAMWAQTQAQPRHIIQAIS